MADMKKVKTNPEAELWSQLKDARAVMLGSKSGGYQMQPMAPFTDIPDKTVWFFTSRDSDLAEIAKITSEAKLCMFGQDRDFYADMTGLISLSRDEKIIDRYWSSAVGAWFEHGREDDQIVLLAFQPNQAAIWASTDSAIKFGWEILKSNLTSGTPDIGYQTVISIGGGKAI